MIQNATASASYNMQVLEVGMFSYGELRHKTWTFLTGMDKSVQGSDKEGLHE